MLLIRIWAKERFQTFQQQPSFFILISSHFSPSVFHLFSPLKNTHKHELGRAFFKSFRSLNCYSIRQRKRYKKTTRLFFFLIIIIQFKLNNKWYQTAFNIINFSSSIEPNSEHFQFFPLLFTSKLKVKEFIDNNICFESTSFKEKEDKNSINFCLPSPTITTYRVFCTLQSTSSSYK